MKKIIAFTGLAIIIGFSCSGIYAQDKLTFKIGYNTGMPVGAFKDVMNKNSFRGFLGELNYPVTDRLRVGLGVSFNDYYEKIPRQLYHTAEGTLSAVVSNSIQTTPVMLKASYELTKGDFIRPYAGVGAGFNLVSYTKYYGEFGNKKTAFKPAAGAEAGINIPFNRQTRVSGLNIGAHFNYLPFDYNDLSYLNNWGIHVAAYFPLR